MPVIWPISVHHTTGSEHKFCLVAHGEIERIARSNAVRVQRLHAKLLKFLGARWTGEMVDLLNALHLHLKPSELRKRLQIKRLRDIMANKLKIRMLEQVIDIRLLTGDERIQTNHSTFTQ
jgi:hypothetical protein